jgi:hypothetical protein
MKIQLPQYSRNLPFFIYDISNQQFITTVTIPSDITDTKGIVLTEQPIPGLNYSPVNSGGMGNRKVSFTIPLIKRDGVVGNVLLLKQFDNLRQPTYSIGSIFNMTTQFTPNPKVLFMWGIGSVPLIWYVAKCDATHKQHWTNAFGMPQYSEIQIELILDESDPINKAETTFRRLSALGGNAMDTIDIIQGVSGRRPY